MENKTLEQTPTPGKIQSEICEKDPQKKNSWHHLFISEFEKVWKCEKTQKVCSYFHKTKVTKKNTSSRETTRQLVVCFGNGFKVHVFHSVFQFGFLNFLHERSLIAVETSSANSWEKVIVSCSKFNGSKVGTEQPHF